MHLVPEGCPLEPVIIITYETLELVKKIDCITIRGQLE
jgi:hypothetical protein